VEECPGHARESDVGQIGPRLDDGLEQHEEGRIILLETTFRFGTDGAEGAARVGECDQTINGGERMGSSDVHPGGADGIGEEGIEVGCVQLVMPSDESPAGVDGSSRVVHLSCESEVGYDDLYDGCIEGHEVNRG